MSASQPWMKFYPQDWRADEKLRLCSLAARGLWMEVLALMHRSERYGQLIIAGHVPTDAQLAVQVGASPHEVTALLAELEGAGVFSRAASGAIYSRRMMRDEKKAKTARSNGKRGGNPKLSKQTENPASDKGQDKPSDKEGLKPQKPEARYSVDKSTGGEPPDPVKEMFDLGVALLKSQGHDEREARSLIGKWRKGRSAGDVAAALVDAKTRSISNIVEWMPKRLSGSGGSDNFLDHYQREMQQRATA